VVALSEIIAQVIDVTTPGGRLVQSTELLGGSSATVHRLELLANGGNTDAVVLRMHRDNDFKGHAKRVAVKEFQVLDALHRCGLAVPAPRLVDAEQQWLVTDWVDGDGVVAPADVAGAVTQMAAFLSELHRLDPAELDCPDVPEIVDPAIGVLPYFPTGHKLRDTLSSATHDVIENQAALIHGDYWPGNVLWRDHELAAVIDWEDAHIGDPLADLATARVELLCAYGNAAMIDFTNTYLDRSPQVNVGRLSLWEIYVSAAALATMHHWDLTPGEAVSRRRDTEGFLERAASEFVREHQ